MNLQTPNSTKGNLLREEIELSETSYSHDPCLLYKHSDYEKGCPSESLSKCSDHSDEPKTKRNDSVSLSATCWISLSAIIGLFYVFTNVVKSEIAHYGFWTRCLQAPGNIVTNLLSIWFYTKYQNSQQPHSLDKTKFRLFRDIFCVRVDIKETKAIINL